MNKFIKDILNYLPSQFLPALTAFITTPILTRLFPPAEYGYWALASGISAFLVALTASGFGSAVIRFYPIYKARSDLDIFFASLSVSIAVPITVVVGLSILTVNLFKNHFASQLYTLLPIVILIFIAQSIFTIFISVMRAQGHSRSYTIFQLLMSYGGLGLGLLLVLVFGLRIKGLLWGSLLALVISIPFLIILVVRDTSFHSGSFHVSEAMQFWQFAWPLALGNIAMWGLRVSDIFIISMFRPEREVGLYSVSYNISSKSIELLVSLFLLSVSPLVMTTWENQGRDATEKVLMMVTRVYLIACLPSAIGLTVLARPFLALLAAQEYSEGSKIVGFVIFSSFAWGLSNIALMGMVIKKKTQRLAINQIIAASIHIILAFLLVPYFGYIATAITTLIGFSVLLALQTWGSKPHIVWRIPIRTSRNAIIASSLMGLVAWSVYRIANYTKTVSPAFLLLSIGTSMLTYVVILWGLGEIQESEKERLMQIWRHFFQIRQGSLH